MTDRVSCLVVTLEKDMRVDDAASIISAISSIRGVYSVKVNVSDLMHHAAVQQAKHDLEKRLWKALND